MHILLLQLKKPMIIRYVEDETMKVVQQLIYKSLMRYTSEDLTSDELRQFFFSIAFNFYRTSKKEGRAWDKLTAEQDASF